MATLSKRRAALLAGGAIISIFAQHARAQAQQAPDQFQALGDIEVTATRTEQPVARAASAVTVISAEDIEKRGASGLEDVLRGTPGLDIYSNGGVGTVTPVFLRGSTPGQTLVLLDGVRINDPSITDGSVDLGAFSAGNIERIEVLRGPQSALYGSDAMGGVINIITRKGEAAPHGSSPRAEDQGQAMLLHPALERDYPAARRIVIPEQLTICGGPMLPAALDRLSDAMARISR